jgi:probable rRNA maturation factor
MADRMLGVLGLENCELSVLLTDDAKIRKLNLEHRKKDSATDVLAFPLDGGPTRSRANRGARSTRIAENFSDVPPLLGDVVISLDTAARQARTRRRELILEVRLLLAHGILHLIGYDHRTPSEKRRMHRMTQRLVGAAGDPRAPAGARAEGPHEARAPVRRSKISRSRSKRR